MYAVGRLSNYISQGVYTVAAPFHPFGGAVDIIVVEQEDGTFKCSPWYVKFGKFQGVLKRREKIVTVAVNGEEASFHMYLDHKGEAYFLKEVESDDEETSIFSPPSAPSSGDEVAVDPRSDGRRINFKEDNSTKGDEKMAGNALLNSSPSDSIVVRDNKEETLVSLFEQTPSSEEKQVGSDTLDVSDSKSSSMKNGVKNGKILSKSPSRKKSIFSLVFRRSQRFQESQVIASDTDQSDGQCEVNDFQRSSSLERAEIVADLLDSKWATGDSANNEENAGDKFEEIKSFSGSSGDNMQPLQRASEKREEKIISDDICMAKNDDSFRHNDSKKQDESSQESSVQVICNHDGESAVENCACRIGKLDQSIQHSDSGTCISQLDTVIFSIEESLSESNKLGERISGMDNSQNFENSNPDEENMISPGLDIPDPVELHNVIAYVEDDLDKFDVFREQTFANDVAYQSGNSACYQEQASSPQIKITNPVESSNISTDVLLTSIDDVRDAKAVQISSFDFGSEVSDLSCPLPDAVANSELCIESEERINTIQKAAHKAHLQFAQCSSDEREQMEYKEKKEEDLQQIISILDPNEFSCECNNSVSFSDIHCGGSYESGSLLPADGPDTCAETGKGTKHLLHVQEVAVDSITEGGYDENKQNGCRKKPDMEAVIHVIHQKEVTRSSFCDSITPRENIIPDQKMVPKEVSYIRSHLLDLVDHQDPCTKSNEGIKTLQQVPDKSLEAVTEGRDDEIEKYRSSAKPDDEAVINVMRPTELDGSSLCDFDNPGENRTNQKLLPEEDFNYTTAQEDMNVTMTCNNLIDSKLESGPRTNFQRLYDLSASQSVFKQYEAHKLEAILSNNNSLKHNECHVQTKKTFSNQTARNESSEDLELTFNDEYVLNSCLALSDLRPPIEEETRENDLPNLIGQEEQVGRVSGDANPNEELFFSDQQPDEQQTQSTFNVNVTAVIEDYNLEHLNGNVFQLSRAETIPINIPRLHMEGKGDNMRGLGSLPNVEKYCSDTENADDSRVFSRSLDFDSCCLKQVISHETHFSTSQNTESRATEKATVKDWTTREDSCESSKNWNTTDTAIASVQPDTGIELSLCRHLLCEGMGTDAAVQAFDSLRVSVEQFHNSGADITKNENLVVKIGGRYFPWDAAAPLILGMVAFGLEGPVQLEDAIPVERVGKALGRYASDSFVTHGGGWRLWPFFRRSKTPERCYSAQTISRNDLIDEPQSSLQGSFDGSLNDYYRKCGKRKTRSNTPTSEQLATLNLKEGHNIITFTFSTRVLGKQQVDARIYLWKWNTRIVVSDVDGTITRSDVLGQFMPLVGKDWTQSGVAQLFSAIKDNGYQLLFLSARAIAQAYITRQFLLNIKQDGKALPDGPIVISPDGLFPSLYREVIRRAPHEFKIACLEDIRRLFPPDCNPFYAGFGNRDTDEISYLKVGIPKGKIFIINPKGEVAVNHRIDMKSYTSLHKLVNGMFPAMSSSEQEDFNSWNYWKMPLPDIDV